MHSGSGHPRQSGALRALLIEANASAATVFEGELRRTGVVFDFHVATDALEAARRLDRGLKPDVVFANLALPRSEIVNLLQELHGPRVAPHPLLIGLTDELSCAAIPPEDFGLDALLLVPVATDDLTAVVLLARAASARAPAGERTGSLFGDDHDAVVR